MDTTTEVEILSDLDFRAEIPCEAKHHGDLICGGSAVWQQVASCGCPDRLVCEAKRKHMTASSPVYRCDPHGVRITGLRYYPIDEAI